MSAPRRVALILDGAGVGGTERHVQSLLQKLPDHGFEVHLGTSAIGPLVATARAHGIAVCVIPRYPAARYVVEIARWLRRVRPDLVHTHSGRLACAAARLAGVPLVLETRHGLGETASIRLRNRWEGWKSRVLADRTVAVCHADARLLVESAGLPRYRVAAIPNGLPEGPPDHVQPAGPRLERAGRVLGFVGRLAPIKAPERVLDLLAALAEGGDWSAILSGDGPRRASLESTARALGVADRVTWTGPVASAYPVLSSLDLLCVPSRTEGLPYVLLEALSVGLPVLATPVGGIPETLCGPVLSAGCLDWDPQAWAARAQELTTSAAKESWRPVARARAAEFSEAAMVGALARLYRDCLDDLGRDRRELAP